MEKLALRKEQRRTAVIRTAATYLAALSLATLCGTAVPQSLDPYLRPAQAPAPANNQMTPARVELGKLLFFDPRLSGSNWISCASCHNPTLGWSDGLPTGIGHGMKPLARATRPTCTMAYTRRWKKSSNTMIAAATSGTTFRST
jgi:cytochrome c peroxidase